MKILLDENMPHKLLAAIAATSHEVDSIKSLRLQGIDNGALYRFAESNYDLCFTRDQEFSRRVRSKPAARLKPVRVVIPQTRQDEFVVNFLTAFIKTDWSSHESGDDWPVACRDG